MNFIKIFFIIIVHFVMLFSLGLQESGENEKILLVICFNGFRNDYLSLNITPNILRLQKEGTYANDLKSTYPTKSLINLHSMATGFYPESHGLTSHSIYDRELNKTLHETDREMFNFKDNIIPIWILNEKCGGISGCILWPGSEFLYDNRSCTYVEKSRRDVSLMEEIDLMFSLILQKRPKTENIPNLIMFYSKLPGKTAQIYGVNSEEVHQSIEEIDLTIGYLEDKLERVNLTNQVNLILIGNNGMENFNIENVIDLRNYLETGTYDIFGESPVLQIVPRAGKLNEIYENLKKFSQINRNFDVYWNNEIPRKWKFQNEQRVGPITAIAREGFVFQDVWNTVNSYELKYNRTYEKNNLYGIDGYSNELDSMKSFLIAKGSAFFQGDCIIETINSVDIFNLICEILHIDCPRRQGELRVVRKMLLERRKSLFITKTIIACGMTMMASIFIGLTCLVSKIKKKFIENKILKEKASSIEKPK